MKKKIAIILAVVMCCGLCLACKKNTLAGTYRTSFEDPMGRAKICLILEKNGNFKIYKLSEGETEEMLEEGFNLFPGKYTVKKQTIVLKLKYNDPVENKQKTDEYEGTVLTNGNIRLEFFARSNLLIKQK